MADKEMTKIAQDAITFGYNAGILDSAEKVKELEEENKKLKAALKALLDT